MTSGYLVKKLQVKPLKILKRILKLKMDLVQVLVTRN